MKHTNLVGPIAAAVLSLTTATTVQSQARTIESVTDTRTDVELGAALCVNEASWNTADCAAIIHMRQRLARSRGVTFREAMHRVHGDLAVTRSGQPRLTAALRTDRATNPREGDSRPWIGDLREDMHRPLGFRDDGSWESRFVHEYETVLNTVRGVLGGSTPDTCRGGEQAPSIWGGPHVDAGAIARKEAQGWRRATCPGARNVYMYFVAPANPDGPTPPRARPVASIEPGA